MATDERAPETGPWVVIAAGGTLEAAFLPARLFELRADYLVRVSVALTPGAQGMVTTPPLHAITGGAVYTDPLQADAHGAPLHLAYSDADALLLWPASGRILAQCALGEITCPATRLFAFTPKDRVVVAPAVHPRMDRRLYAGHVERLRALGCAVLGGDDLFASFAEARDHLVARLSLARRPASAGVSVVADLG